MIKAVVFDMDGTILNTIDDITAAVNHTLAINGMPSRSVDEVKRFVGNGLFRTLELSVPEGTSREYVEGIYEDYVAYYKGHSSVHTSPYNGIVDSLRLLKNEGYKLAVVSNKRQEAVDELCERFYKGLFDISLGDCEGMAKKPAPDMIERVLDFYQIKADEAVYVGDSEVDVMTARNSGLDGVFVLWGFRDRKTLVENGATIIVETPDMMVEAIRLMGEDK